MLGAPDPVTEAASGALSWGAGPAFAVAARSWAACLRRVFEIDPLLCPSCSSAMIPVAVLLDDQEIQRLLSHLGLPTAFPKTKPARSPQLPILGEDTQIDPRLDAWDRRDLALPVKTGEFVSASGRLQTAVIYKEIHNGAFSLTRRHRIFAA